jgi:uncharacterized protein (TIGR03435 family)
MVGSSQTESLAFDAASVKASARMTGLGGIASRNGGPGTPDPTRVAFRNYTLRELIEEAFEVDSVQLSAPGWLLAVDPLGADDKFDIDARVPSQATQHEFRLMLRALLVDRFDLQVHIDQRVVRAYVLSVDKSGSKIRPSLELPSGDVRRYATIGPEGSDGFPRMPPGHVGHFSNVSSGTIRMKFMRQTLSEFAAWLWFQMKEPVVDRTNLSGQWDFYLEYARRSVQAASNNGQVPAARLTAPDLRAAVKEQLGLNLVLDKASVETLVLDRVLRTPRPN